METFPKPTKFIDQRKIINTMKLKNSMLNYIILVFDPGFLLNQIHCCEARCRSNLLKKLLFFVNKYL